LKSFHNFKILKKVLHAGWAAVGRKPGQAEGSRPVRCWLLHVPDAYDRHSYASIGKDAGVCRHHHGSCANTMVVVVADSAQWGVDSVSHTRAASAHVCQFTNHF